MYMKKSEKGIKKFTEAEKLAILKEAQINGVKDTLAKYELYPATFYYWKRNYSSLGEEGLKHKNKEVNQQLKDLIAENSNLKILLAEKELELKYPELSLKKARHAWKKWKWSEK